MVLAPTLPAVEETAVARQPSVAQIFLAFLAIGATSFGGGVVAYLRNSLVGKHEWIDDPTFVELLAISQTLPGLNATNMSILVGDRLQGAFGAVAATIGICLPGALFMYAAGVMYHAHGDGPMAAAVLRGVVAAAVGLILATVVQLGRKSLSGVGDLALFVLTVLAVNQLHQSVLRVLVAVGALGIFWYRPRKATAGAKP